MPKRIGNDENGSAVYEDANYRQLTRVTYVFQNEPGYDTVISVTNYDLPSRGHTLHTTLFHWKDGSIIPPIPTIVF